MLLTDLPVLFENSYSIALNTQLMKVDLGRAGNLSWLERSTFLVHIQPAERGGSTHRVRLRRRLAIGGKLFMITFEAPDVFYYERDLPAYRAIVARATVGGGSSR